MEKLTISVSDIDIIVTKLDNSYSNISEKWESIKSDDLNKIKNSWFGKDCEAYLEKILALDGDLKKALEAQKILSDTFKKSKNEILEMQASLANSISRL